MPAIIAENCLLASNGRPVEQPAAIAHMLGFLIHQNLRRNRLKTFVAGLVCVLIAGAAAAQSNSEPVLKPRTNNSVQDLPSPTSEQKVPPDAAVLTLEGVCDKGTPAADCKTVVRRNEFEKVVNSIQPNMPKQQQKALASQYALALLLAQKAHDEGLDKTPEFDEQLKLQRLQLLARLGQESVQKQAAQVSDADIEAYYKQHAADFQLISYDRLYIPKQKQVEVATQKPNDLEAQKQREASEGAMKEEAEKLRVRAAAGEDFTKLQQEAYDFSGQKLKATNTQVENVPKAHFPASDASIFELKAGDVSQVLNDPQAYMVYKIKAKKDQPLEEVKPEITRLVQQQKVQQAIQDLRKTAGEKAKLDDTYFAVPAPPTLRNPGDAVPSGPPAATQPSGKK